MSARKRANMASWQKERKELCAEIERLRDLVSRLWPHLSYRLADLESGGYRRGRTGALALAALLEEADALTNAELRAEFKLAGGVVRGRRRQTRDGKDGYTRKDGYTGDVNRRMAQV